MTDALLNDIGQILWRQSWQLALMIAIVWPITVVSEKRYPRFSFLLWLAILTKSLVPIQIDGQLFKTPDILNDVQGMMITPAIQAITESTPLLNLSQLAILSWLIIVSVLMTRLLISEIKFRAALTGKNELMVDGVSKLKKKLDLQIPVKIESHSLISNPMTLGFREVVVLLPENMRGQNSDKLLPVIAHELAHIKRRDLWSISLQALSKILYFFNPLIFVVNRQLDLNRERICDEMAVDALNMDRKKFGRELLTHMEAAVAPQTKITIAGGMFMHKSNIVKRFESIMEGKGEIMLKMKMGQKLIFIGVLGMMVILSCSSTKMEQNSTAPEQATNMVKRIDPVDGSISRVTAPPKPEEDVSVKYDTPPTPVGGYSAIQKAVVYPDAARKSGLEGTVIVQLVVEKDGRATKAVVLKGVEDNSLNKSALKAITSIAWNPAMNMGEAIAVRVAVPVVFKLKSD